MAGFRTKKAVVGVIKESTPFSYLEPTAGDTWPAFDIEVNYEGENYQRKETSAHFGKPPEIPGPATGTISFKLAFVGASGGGVAPYYGTALQGSGLRQEITAGTTVAYKPWSTFDGATGAGPPSFINPGQAYTVAMWEDGVQYAIKGAVGKVKLVGKMGEPLVWEYTWMGAYVAPLTDTTPAYTATTLSPPSFLGATLTVHTFAAVFTEFSLDLGNEVNNSENANDTTGIRGCVATDRRPVLTLNPEMELIATHDWFGKWRSGATGAFSVGPIATGAGAGLKITVAATTVQYRAPKMSSRNDIRSLDIEMPVVTSGAEGSDFTISLT